jgi:hypothetical protein
MVTEDVPAQARAQLLLQFDRVVEIPVIEYPSRPMPTEKQAQMYESWIARSYTKWNALTMAEYAKVILIDADMLFLANCDNLFAMRPPAACFSFPWAPPWGKGDIENRYTCDGELPHGSSIPAAVVLDAARTSSKTFVGGASIMLLVPDVAQYSRLIEMLHESPIYAEGRGCVNGVDEISVAELYASAGTAWTHIHQQYTAIPWKRAWCGADIRAHHYHGHKPWLMSVEEWPDLADWWATAADIAARQPELGAAFPLATPKQEPAVVMHTYPETARATPLPKISVTTLDLAAAELQLTRDIITRLAVKKTSRNAKAKAREALISWMQALHRTSAAPAWSAVHRQSALDDESSNIFADTLISMGLALKREAGTTVRDVLRLVANRLSRAPPRLCALVSYGTDIVTFGPHFSAEITPQIRHYVKTAGERATISSLMRHEAALSAAPQYLGLYEDGYRFEVFASPFSRLFFAHPDATFCSAFPDTDTALGSLGDFFKITVPGATLPDGNWVIHPAPAADMTAAAKRVAEVLARPGPELRVGFLTDSGGAHLSQAFQHLCNIFMQETKPLQDSGRLEVLFGTRGCIAHRKPPPQPHTEQ